MEKDAFPFQFPLSVDFNAVTKAGARAATLSHKMRMAEQERRNPGLL
jgi:hypothetical protein